MPLKLLKRTSDHYDVVSKSTFVISVTLLDNGIMECTLDADSTGTDCLHNISQRLALHQPEFFGLRYISRGVPPRQRWIDLEQPLKKQLDKYAEESRLSLGVMFYVNDVNLLKDEMTRYHYFLQLKSDVIDGKLNCSIDQAISLAAYSLQAEFGDYDPERHTVEYLRDFAILPKDLTTEACQDINVNAVFDAVARQYGSLLGFPPPLAEIYYIMVAQQLDGYGQECYPAKDDSGNDILVCASMNGLVIKRRDWTHIAAFRWREIKSALGNKKIFVLETTQSHRIMHFHFTDSEVVKYVRKICALQSTFQKSNPNLEPQNYEFEAQRHTGPSFQSVDSYEIAEQSIANRRATPDLIRPNVIGSLHSLNNNFPHNQTQSKSSYSNLQLFQNNSLPSTHYRHHMLQQQQDLHKSLQELSRSTDSNTLPLSFIPIVSNPSIPTDSADYASRSNHHLDAAEVNPNHDIRPLLPSYRPAPDYDTAVQLKYGRQNEHENEEEPIYQNEIVSKIHSIDLREREIQGPKLRSKTPIPGISSEQYQQDNSAAAPLSYLSKPPPPYPGSSQTINFTTPQNDPKPCKSGSNSSIYHGTTKSRTSFNAHSEVLKQISKDLYNRSLEQTVARYASGNPAHEHNPLPQKQQVLANSLQEKVGATSNTFDEQMKSQSQERERFNGTFSCSKAQPHADSQDPTSKEMKPECPRFCRPIDPTVMKEFQSIQKAKANPSFTVGMKRENAKRNRTPNVLPYDDNSIHLTPTKQNVDGYINASPISIQIGGRIWKYIVGQIPLHGNGPCTLWQMMWESGSKIIVSLERDSSAPFYPDGMETLTFGDFQVSDCNRQRDAATTKSSIAKELMLTVVSKKKQRRVWLLPYEDEWKNDVPVDTEHFLCFLEEVNSVQRKVSEGAVTQPLTVLCGTGAGRSGVFVLSDILLHAADTGHKVRCDSLLSHLRTERMLLVTHPPQYNFVLDTLAKYLAQSRLI